MQTAQGGDAQQLPAYLAEVRVEGHPLPSTTGRLTYTDKIEFEYYRPGSDEPISDAEYHISFANGAIRSGTTNQNGKVKEEDVPPVDYEVSFA